MTARKSLADALTYERPSVGRMTLTSPRLMLDESKVTKKGYLYKRGNIFSGYSSKYIFYLEENCLKYGKKGKPISTCIDLNNAIILRHEESKKKFKIYQGKTKLKLKADNFQEREQWVEAVSKITKKGTPQQDQIASQKDSKPKNSSKKHSDKRLNSPSKKSDQKITLTNISEMLQNHDSKLNQNIEASQANYDTFLQVLQEFEQKLDRKHKERFTKVQDSVSTFQQQVRSVFEMISFLNQSLFKIVETIAEKEIKRDPIEFIRKESFVQPHEVFKSFRNTQKNTPAVVKEDDEESKEDDYIDQIEQRISYINADPSLTLEEEKYQLYHYKSSDSYNQENFVEELGEIFHDANDYFPSESMAILTGENGASFINIQHRATYIKEDTIHENGDGNQEQFKDPDDPVERQVLPYFKDPKIKISIWTILKDSLGKDITKMTMPVYFNDPTNMMQRCAATQEYNHILDEAIEQTDPLRRLAYVCIYSMSCVTNMERNTSKPFNPLLGETYELVTQKYRFIAELVSHHPPITAFEVQGYSGYKKYTCSRVRQKFTGKSLLFNACYKDYIELTPHNEKFEINSATISVHNLIIGSPYLDVRDKCVIKSMTRPGEYGVLHYHERGWNASSYFRVDGEIFNANKEVVYKIEGRWNEYANLINVKTGEKECIWRKNPYPENWQFMYGMSHFMIQLNYLPNFLRNKIAPTDTRLRPDQRALENGDLKLAADEKTRLEEKQRAVRKYKEKQGIQHKPAYFDEWKNPDDNDQVYYRYNGLYFDKDRKEQDWSRLPDLFSNQIPPEVEEFNQRKQP